MQKKNLPFESLHCKTLQSQTCSVVLTRVHIQLWSRRPEVRGPELHERGDHRCMKRCLWGDLQPFLIALCERIKPGPFTATGCHPRKRLLVDLCQMLRLKARTRRCRTVFGLSACVSGCVSALWCQAAVCVPQVFDTTPGLCTEKSSSLSSTLTCYLFTPCSLWGSCSVHE